MDDVVIARFDELAQARAATSELRRLSAEDAITLRGVALVVRDIDGRFSVPEDEEDTVLAGTATGGAIGALLGALAGPAGLLVGGATGAVIGSLVDAVEAAVSEEVLAAVTRRVPPGTTALVADIGEPAPRLVDAAIEASGGVVVRWRRADIEAQIGAAEEAMRAAQLEAVRVARKRRTRAASRRSGAARAR